MCYWEQYWESEIGMNGLGLMTRLNYQKFVAGWCLNEKQKRSRALVKRLTPQEGEINETDISKVLTISNWIGGFAKTWKRAMAERSLEKNKNTLL
ncbi:hypothetical protein C2G38_2175768 [Gigaspora rosea]|uniref:Uncharacterized protein n=1 Tax=Gigaspora rosea TaxID=44941 RepID=A0A397VIW3_9GLOM|nr:hypothetical protein C2G38_2175768 [Gigaspora rosea]